MTQTTATENEMATISQAEWEIMRVIWAESPLTSREIIDRIMVIFDWKESTIKTLINRLVQKKHLNKDESESPFLYSALITEKEANYATFDEAIDRVCTRDRFSLLHHLIESNDLSKDDIQALIDQLSEKIVDAPQDVACQCPPGQCHCHIC